MWAIRDRCRLALPVGVPVLLVACLAVAACQSGGEGCGTVRDVEVTDQVHPVYAYFRGSRCEFYQTAGVPEAFRTSGEALYFAGTTDGRDRGIWISDGTASGTRLLVSSTVYQAMMREILPVTGGMLFTTMPPPACASSSPPTTQWTSSLPLWWTDDRGNSQLLMGDHAVGEVVLTGDSVFFSAAAIDRTVGLWTADVRSRQVQQIASFASIDSLLAVPGPGVFVAGRRADDPSTLWYSDGTTEGTRGLTTAPGRLRIGFAAAGRRAFFLWPYELWTSDGTPAGTGPVPGAPTVGARPWEYDAPELSSLVGLGEKLVFFFEPQSNRPATELWITDGTTSTQRLAAFSQPTGWSWGAAGLPKTVSEGRLYFFNGNALWRSDGTPAGTGPFLILPPPGTDHGEPSNAWFLGAPRGTLFVETSDGAVWRIDGNDAERVAIEPNVSLVYPFAATPSRIYYVASTPGDIQSATIRALTCED